MTRIDAGFDAGVRPAPLQRSVEVVLEFARIGHEAGYPTAELEERVAALGRSLGIHDVEISVTPTVVDVALGPLAQQHSYSIRVHPAAVDLNAIARLDELVHDVLHRGVDADAAL